MSVELVESNVEWQVWARRVSLGSLSAKAVLNELALLADSSGFGIVSINHLTRVCGVSKRQVYRLLNLLESQGVLRREARVDAVGRKTASRFQLLRGEAELVEVEQSNNEFSLIAPSESETIPLTQILKCCVASGWNEFSSNLLVESIASNGERMIRSVTNARNDDRACFEDTLALAFEACKDNAQQIIESEYPWALLKTIVTRLSIAQYRISLEAIEYFEDLDAILTFSEDAGILQTALTKMEVDSVTAEVVLSDVVRLFVEAGLDEGIVQTVNTRLLQIAATCRHSHRHTVAANDATLLKLLGDPKVVRQWMSVLVGTRRNAWSITSPDENVRLSLVKKIAKTLAFEIVA